MKHILFIPAAIGLLFTACGQKSTLDAELQAECQKICDMAVANGIQGAVQFCAYKDGKCIVDVCAGKLSREIGAPDVTPSSLFPIYSTEKPLLATAVHRAVEMGLMNYEKPLNTWWPEFRGPGKDSLTLGLTLGYRSGMPRALDPEIFITDEDCTNWNKIVDWAASAEPLETPGTVQKYMSLSYGWMLGHPLEVAYGKPLKQTLDELVLEPAGIKDEFFFAAGDDKMPRIATLYGAGKDKMNKEIYRRACMPSAWAVASARSVAKFYNRLCGFDGEAPLIRKETLNAALLPCRWESDPLPEDMDENWYMIFGMGYGLWGEKNNISRVFGHGGLGGSEALVDREQKLIVAFTCNYDDKEEKNVSRIRPLLYNAVGMKWRYWKDADADIQNIQWSNR